MGKAPENNSDFSLQIPSEIMILHHNMHAYIFSYVEEKNMRFFYNKKIQLTQRMYIQSKSKKTKNTIRKQIW